MSIYNITMRLKILFCILLFLLLSNAYGNVIEDYIEIAFKSPFDGYEINEYSVTGAGNIGTLANYKYEAIRQLVNGALTELDIITLEKGGLSANVVGSRLRGFAQYGVSYNNTWGGNSWEVSLSLRKGGVLKDKFDSNQPMQELDGGTFKFKKTW